MLGTQLSITSNEMKDYFTREILYSKGTLIIHQATIGDVGHVVWDAALVLSKYLDLYLSQNLDTTKITKVIELGSGTGLVGLVTATHG